MASRDQRAFLDEETLPTRDPMELFSLWMKEAESAEPNTATIINLATATR